MPEPEFCLMWGTSVRHEFLIPEIYDLGCLSTHFPRPKREGLVRAGGRVGTLPFRGSWALHGRLLRSLASRRPRRFVEFDLPAVLPDHAIMRAKDLRSVCGTEIHANGDLRSGRFRGDHTDLRVEWKEPFDELICPVACTRL